MPPFSFWFCVDAGVVSKGLRARRVRMALHRGRRRRKLTSGIRLRALQQAKAGPKSHPGGNEGIAAEARLIRGTAARSQTGRHRAPRPRADARRHPRRRVCSPSRRRRPPPRAGAAAPRRQSSAGAPAAQPLRSSVRSRPGSRRPGLPASRLGHGGGLRASIRRSNARPRVLFRKERKHGGGSGGAQRKSGTAMPTRS